MARKVSLYSHLRSICCIVSSIEVVLQSGVKQRSLEYRLQHTDIHTEARYTERGLCCYPQGHTSRSDTRTIHRAADPCVLVSDKQVQIDEYLLVTTQVGEVVIFLLAKGRVIYVFFAHGTAPADSTIHLESSLGN